VEVSQRIRIFHADNGVEEKAITNLIKSGVSVLDLTDNQIKEWDKNEISLGARNFGNERKICIAGKIYYNESVFIHFPWRNSLLVTFDSRVFRSIRYLRNKYKINSKEQESLFNKEVAIVGMSVGMSVLKAMILEGLAGKYRIADFDSIDISNLNRIDSGVYSVGVSKVEVAYQFAMEQDPFLEISIWNCPIDEDNVKQFFEGPLDMVIDECDSIFTKILLRKEAQIKKIPVLMHTSDRGMLDVELYNEINFDFSWTLSKYSHLTKSEILEKAILIIADYCDFKDAEERSKYSFSEIGKSIISWPQLGGDVLAGGGNVASAARTIFLGNKVAGGRYLLDPTLKFKNQMSGE